jgi:hypothetical protein
MSLRRVALATLAACSLVLAACGGSSSDSSSADTDQGAAVVETGEPAGTVASGPEGSIAALLNDNPAADSALIWGTSQYVVGENRLSFLIVDANGELVDAPSAEVRVARGGLDAIPDLEATAQNLPVGAPAATKNEGDFDVPFVYMAGLELDKPGTYSLLVEPKGKQIQAYGQIEVKAESDVPAVGSPAVPSDNPTVEDDFPEKITTATPPDVDLLQYSVKDSLEAGVPFVVTFATPKFCVSRVCGPVVDIVDAVRKKFESSDVRFIHVEVFQSNDPQQGYNQWMQEWNLPTEPWTFLVDGTGKIRARFEGLITAGELEQAVRDDLL